MHTIPEAAAAAAAAEPGGGAGGGALGTANEACFLRLERGVSEEDAAIASACTARISSCPIEARNLSLLKKNRNTILESVIIISDPFIANPLSFYAFESNSFFKLSFVTKKLHANEREHGSTCECNNVPSTSGPKGKGRQG